MANGQQKAQQNLEAFMVWKTTQTDDDFTQIVHRGQLNRGEIAKAIGCGKSALNQNPALKTALLELEAQLRDRGVLPPLRHEVEGKANQPKLYDNKANQKILDSKKMAELEAENIELKAEKIALEANIKELKKRLKEDGVKLERYGELSEVLFEFDGMMPR